MTTRLKNWLPYIYLFGASAFVYLPFVAQIGLLNDDWYLMFAGKAQGPSAFSIVYAIDRPFRAYVMGAAYALFGDRILYYHLSGFLFRYLGAACFFWSLQKVRPEYTNMGLLASVLFLIYPGFLSQVNPIDYQSQLFALFLAMFSIAATVKAAYASGWKKWAGYFISALTAAFYLGLVEYFIGLEVLRLVCLYLSTVDSDSVWKRIKNMFIRWIPSLTGPLLFLGWRVFVFESARKATDIGSQVQDLIEAPVLRGAWLAVLMGYDTLKAGFLAWGVPLYIFGADIRLREHFVLLAGAVLMTAALFWLVKFNSAEKEDTHQSGLILSGLILVAAAVLPVELVGRIVLFESYSRYTLAAAAGSALILAGFAFSMRDGYARGLFAGVLILIAVITHYNNGARFSRETASIGDFWHQVAWRAPEIKPGTTLIADYPLTAIEEDYFVWGPAALIYDHSSTQNGLMSPGISAVVLTEGNLANIELGSRLNPIERRGILTTPDVNKILVLTQPTPYSCVHVLDRNMAVVSSQEEARFVRAGKFSDSSLIDVNGKERAPSTGIFGSEPEHGWCFYYQKASLAAQREDWETAAELGSEAQSFNLTPLDKFEWLEILIAYARLGRAEDLIEITKDANNDEILSSQICLNFEEIFGKHNLSPEISSLIRAQFCNE